MTLQQQELTIEDLQAIEADTGVTFDFDWRAKAIVTKGKASNIDRALERLGSRRDELVTLLQQIHPAPEDPEVERVIPCNVLSKAVARLNYKTWFLGKPQIFWKTESQLDRMFAAVEEGDEVIFDFSQSFTVRKPNGLLVAINDRGEVEAPSPYSPAMRPRKEKA
jgi:hypothetical protein